MWTATGPDRSIQQNRIKNGPIVIQETRYLIKMTYHNLPEERQIFLKVEIEKLAHYMEKTMKPDP